MSVKPTYSTFEAHFQEKTQCSSLVVLSLWSVQCNEEGGLVCRLLGVSGVFVGGGTETSLSSHGPNAPSRTAGEAEQQEKALCSVFDWGAGGGTGGGRFNTG